MSDNEPEPTEIQALIFDCDGTLADTMPIHFVVWRDTMSRHGIDFSEDRFYELGGVPTERIIQLLSEEQGVSVSVEIASAEKEAAFLKHLGGVKAVESILSIARDHRGKLPMAVGSGSCRSVLLDTLSHLKILDWFEAIVSADDTELHKPAPDVFLRAAELLEVDPKFCRVYEDTDIGLEAARRAGMQAFDVRTVHRPQRIDN